MKRILLALCTLSVAYNLPAQDSLYQKTKNYIHRIDSVQNVLSEELLKKTAELSHTQQKDEMKYLIEAFEDELQFAIYYETDEFKKEIGIDEPEEESDPSIKIISKAIIKKIEKRNDSLKPKKKKKKLKIDLSYQWGINNFFGQSSALTDSSAYDLWGSHYESLDIDFKFPLDKNRQFHFLTGIHFIWSYLEPENKKMYHVVNPDGKLIVTSHTENLDRRKLRTTYYKIPLGLEINAAKHWTVGLQAYGKFYGASKQLLEYENLYAEYKIKEKRYFNQTKITWGAAAYIQYNDFGIYFGMDFAPYFTEHDMKIYQIGIRMF